MGEMAAAIIGGGPAGLAAALTLARAMQETVLFDSPAAPRNSVSRHISAVLAREGMTPGALRETGRAEIARYGRTRFVDDTVISLDGSVAEGFTVRTNGGRSAHAGAVILATGMRDLFPPIPGLSDVWGRSVMNCPFCDGLENAGGAWGVIANRPMIFDVAPIYQAWCADLILFLADGVTPDDRQREALEARGIAIEPRAIARLHNTGGCLEGVELVDGEVLQRDALVLVPFQAQTALVAGLGLAADADGFVTVDEGFRTSRAGIYAAGDLIYGGHQNINTAAHMGNLAAATLVLDKALRA